MNGPPPTTDLWNEMLKIQTSDLTLIRAPRGTLTADAVKLTKEIII
mgnify:CR=1 FL=1